ncbi:hypothetical protein POVWA2_048070 [Plasmodium ovale wallikeri]|uniref:Uncharacterized protein n=1 Tax=Plasmodium ovale wallikeri TaxID=864142 RepID=A0A1A8ZKW9_PLAOA|nr:hypothetical protein POVWA1_049010 [Plasmodium ovale wallikeri]SBT44533.1 hypothetical protein POVWA2_048070 [Plasmodium ovale wallikeri]
MCQTCFAAPATSTLALLFGSQYNYGFLRFFGFFGLLDFFNLCKLCYVAAIKPSLKSESWPFGNRFAFSQEQKLVYHF